MKNKCLNCKTNLNRNKNYLLVKAKYCNIQCQMDFNYNKYIINWKNNKCNGMRGKYQVSSYIRKYLFLKYNSKCCKCGWNEVNKTTGKVPLEINHIDGNFRNNKENNLELICPNCHSLTKSYKALNKGNGRKDRLKYRLK